MTSPSKTKESTAISVWVRGYPVCEAEMTQAYGDLTLTAYRWQNAVCWAVASKRERQVLLYPYLQCRRVTPKSIQVGYRFSGVSGDAQQYVALTVRGIAVAYRCNKARIKTASVTSEPGEPGCWLDIQEVA